MIDKEKLKQLQKSQKFIQHPREKEENKMSLEKAHDVCVAYNTFYENLKTLENSLSRVACPATSFDQIDYVQNGGGLRGHCAVVSKFVYDEMLRLAPSLKEKLKLFSCQMLHPTTGDNESHWFLMFDGMIIDLTYSQYPLHGKLLHNPAMEPSSPYNNGLRERSVDHINSSTQDKVDAFQDNLTRASAFTLSVTYKSIGFLAGYMTARV